MRSFLDRGGADRPFVRPDHATMFTEFAHDCPSTRYQGLLLAYVRAERLLRHHLDPTQLADWLERRVVWATSPGGVRHCILPKWSGGLFRQHAPTFPDWYSHFCIHVAGATGDWPLQDNVLALKMLIEGGDELRVAVDYGAKQYDELQKYVQRAKHDMVALPKSVALPAGAAKGGALE